MRYRIGNVPLWLGEEEAVLPDRAAQKLGVPASAVRDLNIEHFKTSYGFGVRVHNTEATAGRLDIAHSIEG